MNANVSFADLTSATAYFDRHAVRTMDASEKLCWTTKGGAPFVPVPYSERDPSHHFSQELRLTSHDSGGLHWVAGAFYSSLRSNWNEISNSPLAATPAIPDGSYFTSFNPYTVKQTPLFADGYKIMDQWKLSAGVRWYQYKSEQDEFEWGYDGPSLIPPATSLITTASDKGFNPRVDLSYTPSPVLTAYATAARGFRPGGANEILPSPPCTPGALKFGPDSVWNYEIGEKATTSLSAPRMMSPTISTIPCLPTVSPMPA